MGARPVGQKFVRKVEAATGKRLVRVNGFGGHVFEFVTTDHVHGGYDRRDGSWWIKEADSVSAHFSSCYEVFAGFDPEAWKAKQQLAFTRWQKESLKRYCEWTLPMIGGHTHVYRSYVDPADPERQLCDCGEERP